jgi:large subunit ribosomal protein L24
MLEKKHQKVRKDDLVQVMTGEEKGKQGRILRTMPGKGRVVVENVNYIWKHLRRSQKHPQGGRLQKEAPIDVSNVMVVCEACKKPTRVGIRERKEDRDGRLRTFRYRVCKRKGCGSPVTAKDKEYAEKAAAGAK